MSNFLSGQCCRHCDGSKSVTIQRPTKTLFVINLDRIRTRERDVLTTERKLLKPLKLHKGASYWTELCLLNMLERTMMRGMTDIIALEEEAAMVDLRIVHTGGPQVLHTAGDQVLIMVGLVVLFMVAIMVLSMGGIGVPSMADSAGKCLSEVLGVQ
ncbi:hypothetical protein GQ457_02G001330 [Hibiscus cannabinus]